MQPADWAYQTVQNLVEEYGCLAGFPDGSFRGDRTMTRNEFAAAIAACLESIRQIVLIQSISGFWVAKLLRPDHNPVKLRAHISSFMNK